MKDLATAPQEIWNKYPFELEGWYIHPRKCMNPQTCKWRWIRKVNEPAKMLLSEVDGTVFARQCQTCGGRWKIYQNPYHGFNCPHGYHKEKEIQDAIKRGLSQ